jgi:hypothetical protein
MTVRKSIQYLRFPYILYASPCESQYPGLAVNTCSSLACTGTTKEVGPNPSFGVYLICTRTLPRVFSRPFLLAAAVRRAFPVDTNPNPCQIRPFDPWVATVTQG